MRLTAFPLMTPCASGSRMVRTVSVAPCDVRVEILSHRRGVQKRVDHVLRQFAVLVVDRVAPDDHVLVRLVVTDPLDETAPGDVLADEGFEVHWPEVSNVNAFGFLPGGGEEQGDDESEAGHLNGLP